MARLVVVALLALVALVGCTKTPPPYESRYTPQTTTPPPAAATIAVIGDSYTSGTPMGGRGNRGWPALAETGLRSQGINVRMKVAAEGGSGYVAKGQHGHTFGDQIPRVVTPNNGLVIVFGSSNDSRDVPLPELDAAVKAALADVRSRAPDAPMLMIGPMWTRPDPPPAILAVRDIVAAQAQAVGARFVDPLDWFAGRPDVISADQAHPTDAGHVILADRIAPLIAEMLSGHEL